LPAVSVGGYNNRSVCIAWPPNLMHALVKECCISFNDLVAARFDGTHLDFWAAFTTPSAKAEGYRNMIGAQIPTCGGFIPARSLDLPLPFFFSRDSGVALPTAALPYNEMRIRFSFRPWDELIVGFAPKVDCMNYAVGKANATDPVSTDPKWNENSYIIPAFNSSATGVQPCQNSDIWPSCIPHLNPSTDQPGPVPGTDESAFNPSSSENIQKFGYQLSNEMSFILLPKLEGPPTGYLVQQGSNDEVTQVYEYSPAGRSLDKTNYGMSNTIPYYVGEPKDKTSEGVYCNLKELSLKCQVWANYAIVSNEERKKMACAPRDMLIEQVQTTPPVDFFIRNQPETTWWSNNIPSLTTPGGPPNSGWNPYPQQAPIGSGNTGQNESSVVTENGNGSKPGPGRNPDNEVPNGEINWPQKCETQIPGDPCNNNPQQPSGNGFCVNGSASLGTGRTNDGSLIPAQEQLYNTTNTFANPNTAVASDQQWKVGDFDNKRTINCEDNSQQAVRLNLKYSYGIKTLFWAVRNVTADNIHSNYTIGFPVLQEAMTDQVTLDGPVFSTDLYNNAVSIKEGSTITTTEDAELEYPYYIENGAGGINKFVGKIQTLRQSVITCKNGFDPIEKTSMLYETTPRLGLLDSSYYSLTQPYYHAPAIPSSTQPVFCPSGYHMYSYSLEFMSLDPLGSTDYGKLTNVSLEAEPINLKSADLCPLLSYSVPNVTQDGQVNKKYLFGPMNAPGIAGQKAQCLKNQSVIEILVNMAYQNIYTQQGLETISPWVTDGYSAATTKCSYLGKYKFVSTAINNNILRISGGSVGFPVT